MDEENNEAIWGGSRKLAEKEVNLGGTQISN